MVEVYSYGEIGIDNIIRVPNLPSPENAAFPFSDTYHIGGAAANFAVIMASWGVNVGLSGNTIGDDLNGKKLIHWFRVYPSLDLKYLTIQKGMETPFCRILVTPDGERSIMVFGYPKTPKITLTKEMLNGAKYLTLDLYGGEERVNAARLGRSLGVTTVVSDAIWPDHPVTLFSDIIVNSAAYIRQVYPEVNPVEHSLNLHQITGGIIISTDSAEPVHVIDQDGNQLWIQPPKVEVLDATGAGDAFRAGLIYGLLHKCDLTQAVKHGIAAGGLKVSHIGAATSPPTLEEVTEMQEKIEIINKP